LILTTHLHPLLRLRMSRAIPLLALYAFWRVQGHLYLEHCMKGSAYFTTTVALPRGVFCHYSLARKLRGFQTKFWCEMKFETLELMGRHCFPPLLLSFILRPDAGRLRSEFDTGREINSESLRAGREVCGTVITADTAFW